MRAAPLQPPNTKPEALQHSHELDCTVALAAMPVSRQGCSFDSLPSFSNYNSSPETTSCIARASETVYPFPAPVIHLKGERSEDRLPCEAIAPVVEGLVEKRNMEEVGMTQPAGQQHWMDSCMGHDKSKRMQDSQRQDAMDLAEERSSNKGCTQGADCSSIPPQQEEVTPQTDASSERAPCQQEDVEKGVSGEKQGKDLDRTPRKKNKRKKHRPKIMEQGKPARTPKPVTPSRVEEKKDRTAKRHYVRKKGLNSSQTPSGAVRESMDSETATTSGRTIDQQSKGPKSVRRSLNFDSEAQAMDVCQVPITISAQNQAHETSTNTCTTGSFKSTVKVADGLEVVVEHSDAGIAFDLTRSLNQVLEEYIRSPGSATAPDQPSRRELIRENLKQQAKMRDGKSINDPDCFQPSPENSTPPAQPSRREMIRENSKRNNRKQSNSNSQRDEILIEDDIEKNGTKRDRSHVDDTQTCYDAAPRDVHLMQDSEDLRHLMRAIIPKPCKKRRTEKRKTWKYAQVMRRSSSLFTSADLQGQIILDKVQVSEKMFELGRAERTMKKRPELPIRVRTLAYIASIMKCSQILSAPEKPRPQICMEALLIDGGLKTETKKHTKRGRVSVNPMSSMTNQEDGDMSCNCSSDEQRYDALTTPSLINFEIRNSNPMQISSIRECQSSSIVQEWHHASLQSRAIVPYVHPMDNIVQELKCLDINGHQTDTTAQHALIPYGGDGMMVPYKGPFDPTKKPRPRAKVDLDPESNRVWKLLMGKESHDEADGSDLSKEKWLEEDRKIYRGRAESFILRMRLLQGNRRFSQWKGSVVDSVVGVFLTQNVSDHLSSSAFMHLAARFPARPKGNSTESVTERMNTPEEQGDESILNMDDASKWQEDTLCPEFGDQGSTVSHEVEQKEDNEIGNSGISLERYYGGITTEYIKSKGWDNHGRELQMGDQTPQNRIDNPVTGSTSSPEPEYKRSLEDVVVLSSQSSVSSANSEAYLINGTKRSSSDCSNSSVEPVQIAQTTRTQEPYNCGTEWKCSIECCSAIAQRESINASSTNEYTLELDKHRSEPQQEGRKADSHVENTQHTVGVLAPMQYHETQSACSNSCKTSEAVMADETDLKDEGNSSQLPDMAKSTSKNKVEEADTEKETFDWDNLRKEACCNGADRERSNERLDSLDWEAVRNADVNEIAQTIKDRGMHNVLAQKIKDFLDRVVKDHGSTNLEWLRNVPPDKAKEYLLSIRGLGLKSVECIRLLTLNHHAFPVDTNVGRICVRLGWVPLKPLPGDVQFHLLEQYPMMDQIQRYIWPRLSTLAPETLYELHYHMITFGKVFCTKRRPNCDACPMRGDCRHYASECASARLKLQWPEEKNPVSSMIPITSDDCGPVFNQMHVPQLDGIQLSQEGRASPNCGPIIEEPASPEPESIEALEPDFEDLFSEDPDEIPHIKLNLEGTQNLHNLLQADNVELEDSDLLKAIVALTTEAVSIPMPKLKNAMRLRTEHQVYELPDSHPLLERVDQREPDDPCPYLLAIWTPGETAQSTQQPETCCNSQELGIIDNNKTCSSASNMQEVHAQTVRGTLLIPCRTAMRGSFPLNGTYFQVNEVFADHDTSCKPMDIPREWIWNLPRRTVYVGSSVPAIFRGLTAESVQHCFYRGYVCVRGFDRKTRRPMPLTQRLHFSAYKASRDKKAQAKEE